MCRAHYTAKQVTKEVDRGNVDLVIHVGDIAVCSSHSKLSL